MKKIILNLLILVLVFGTVTTVFAEDDDVTENSAVVCAQDAKQCPDGSYVSRVGSECEFAKCPNYEKEKEGLMQRIRNLFQNRKEETKNKIEDRVASSTERKVAGKLENASKKYLKTIEREEAIMAKIVSRIEKIKSNGGNTTEAEKLVAEAKNSLLEARKNYEILKSTVISADNATTTKQFLSSIRESTKLIEKHLRDAHKSLQKTVGSLRGVSQLRNASSTKEN